MPHLHADGLMLGFTRLWLAGLFGVVPESNQLFVFGKRLFDSLKRCLVVAQRTAVFLNCGLQVREPPQQIFMIGSPTGGIFSPASEGVTPCCVIELLLLLAEGRHGKPPFREGLSMPVENT